jgi:hypothetical protein
VHLVGFLFIVLTDTVNANLIIVLRLSVSSVLELQIVLQNGSRLTVILFACGIYV